MNLVLFIHEESSKTGETLKNSIHGQINGANFQIVQTLDALKTRIKQVPSYGESELFILLVDTKQRLNELYSFIDLMEDKRLILILPDNSKEIISRAHQFFPRYFTVVSDNYDDLKDVLNKIINNNHFNNRGS